jgi:biopolymer transport protein TolQ
MRLALAQAAETAAPAAGPTIDLDPVSLILNASGPVMVVVWMLIVAAVLVWFIAVLKLLQLRRWRTAQARFEGDALKAQDADTLFDIARHHGDAPGARVVFELQQRRDNPKILESSAKRALVIEQQRASTMLPTLASIGSASPFIGLFGTVYGIMDAFLRIGREKSASLPVVAPAIGEALIATAIGLFAAIPAVIAYNAIQKRMDDLMDGVEASADAWVALVVPSRSAPRNRV